MKWALILSPFTAFGLLWIGLLFAEWVERTIHSWGARTYYIWKGVL